MAKTLIHLTLEAPHTSLARIGDFMDDVRALLPQHKIVPVQAHFTQEAGNGPQSDGAVGRGDLGRSRSEAGDRAAEDFAEGTGGAAAEPAAEPVKRGRGRPRKQRDGDAAEAGTAAGSEQHGDDSAGRAEGRGRNVARGTDEGTEQGGAEGQGRARSSRADRGTERGNSDQARISSGEDRGEAKSEWDDAAPETAQPPRRSKADKDDGPEHHAKVPDKAGPNDTFDYVWPEHLMPETVTADSLSEMLAEHFNATGGKDRQKTFDIMEKATGVRKLSEVHEDDYDNLAAGLLKDMARHKYGIKPAVAK